MTQEDAFTILKTGANVFLTGEPGSGKTHMVNRYVAYLREHEIEPSVTASTGIAATHIGGMTVHSWSGIGIHKFLTDEDLDKLSTNERLSKRINKAKVLIIDEISMLDAETLSLVDLSIRTVRRSEEAFGGMQVIFVGDFFQLPPVYRNSDSQFAFRSQSWQSANPLVCYLTEQHRQDDEKFLTFLAQVRSGDVTEQTHETLNSRMNKKEHAGVHTRLYSHNINVDKENDAKLSAISGVTHRFEMESRGPDGLVLALKKGCLSPDVLELKVGAHVMFTKNSFEQGFVNGTLGIVEAFDSDGTPIVKTKSGKSIWAVPMEWSITDGSRTLAAVNQLPLRLAWAMTVHKSQGMTLDSAVVDLSEAFEYGQGYVALSRVRTLAGLHLLGYNARALEMHPEIAEVDQTFKEISAGAESAFKSMSKDEIAEMERNFINACGGTIKKSNKLEKKKKTRALKARGLSTHDQTLALVQGGASIEQIAEERAITEGTVVGHLEELFMKGKLSYTEIDGLVTPQLSKQVKEIKKLFDKHGTEKLAPVFVAGNEEFSYEDLRLVRLLIHSSKVK
jgi:nucleoside-triphosphatase THEP1/DNA-binding NarL/FixJ family response regulator